MRWVPVCACWLGGEEVYWLDGDGMCSWVGACSSLKVGESGKNAAGL